MRQVLIALILALLAGCSMLPATGQRPASSHYVLALPSVDSAPVAPRADAPVLLLRDTETPGVFQSVRLVYSRVPGVLNHYQFARWSEAPANALNTLLRQRLNAAGLYSAVVPMGAGVVADFQLNTRLQSFYHDATTAPGMGRLTLEAELVNRHDARLIAHYARQHASRRRTPPSPQQERLHALVGCLNDLIVMHTKEQVRAQHVHGEAMRSATKEALRKKW